MKNKKTKGKSLKKRIKKNRPIHKKILLHPGTAFVLLCIGVFLIASTIKVYSESYLVTATVQGPPITESAVIASPADQSSFSTSPITVKGTCPNNSYVKLSRNGIFSGMQICHTGNWEISSDLSEGTNVFKAHIFNFLDVEGPISNTVTVNFTRPVVAATATPTPVASTTPSSTPATPSISTVVPWLVIKPEYSLKAYQKNQPVKFTLSLVGGVEPFAVHVTWGDGNESNYARKDRSSFEISHTYKQTSGDYTIMVSASDAEGRDAHLQLAVIFGKPKDIPAFAATTGSWLPLLQDKTILSFLWPSYIIVILMIASFYLGERREYESILMRRRKKRYI